jgi:hypothetical protein
VTDSENILANFILSPATVFVIVSHFHSRRIIEVDSKHCPQILDKAKVTDSDTHSNQFHSVIS